MRLLALSLLLFVLALTPPTRATAEISPHEGISVMVLPATNATPEIVRENRYWPKDILPIEIQRYFVELLKDAPLVQVVEVDDPKKWFDDPYREGELAVQLEVYRFVRKTREHFYGATERGHVAIRMNVYDGESGKLRFRSVFDETDSRASILPLDVADGSIVPGEAGGPAYRPGTTAEAGLEGPLVWATFVRSATWNAFQKTLRAALTDLMRGYTGYRVVGRILSPTADSTKDRRSYIISLGKWDSLKLGDVLGVARSDTYVTVDPENPVVVMPRLIGKMTVVFLKQHEAVAVVTEESKEEPIQLKDLVVLPLYKPRKGEW